MNQAGQDAADEPDLVIQVAEGIAQNGQQPAPPVHGLKARFSPTYLVVLLA